MVHGKCRAGLCVDTSELLFLWSIDEARAIIPAAILDFQSRKSIYI